MKTETDASVEKVAIAMLDQMQSLRKLVANQNESLVAINALLEQSLLDAVGDTERIRAQVAINEELHTSD